MSDARLDGNAAAGVLSEAFAMEMTTAMGTCASCGARGAVGATLVYEAGPGTVVRCPSCEAVLMRFARIRGRLMMEMSGVGSMELPASPSG